MESGEEGKEGRNLTASVIAGVVFGGLNLWLLSRIVQGLAGAENVKKWKVGLLFFAKMALFITTIVLILKYGYVSPLPFLAGFTASLVVGVTAVAIGSHREKSEE